MNASTVNFNSMSKKNSYSHIKRKGGMSLAKDLEFSDSKAALTTMNSQTLSK